MSLLPAIRQHQLGRARSESCGATPKLVIWERGQCIPVCVRLATMWLDPPCGQPAYILRLLACLLSSIVTEATSSRQSQMSPSAGCWMPGLVMSGTAV